MLGKTYRSLRHGAKLRINFMRNFLRLQQIRSRNPGRKIIAVMLLEHLGDIVACEPVARYLRERSPDACIIWCVRSNYRELLDHNPDIDEVLTHHCLSERLFGAWSRMCDEVIDLHFEGRYCSLCAKPLLKRSGSHVSLSNFYDYGGILSALCISSGLPPLDSAPNVHIPQFVREKVDALGLPDAYIVVHALSNAAAKDWTAQKWHELLTLLSKRTSLPVVEVGSLPYLGGHPHVLTLCGSLSILESAEVIRRARLFIGVDSGPAHLANAAGTRGVILIGSYLGFDSYTPFSGGYGSGENAVLVRAEGAVASIAVQQVLEGVSGSLSSRGRES